MKQIQDLTPTPATSTIDAVSNNRSHKQCGNCGGTHAPRKCPAYGTTCCRCHKKNHWRQVCRSGSSGIANTGGGQAAHAKASTKPTKRHGWSPRRPGHRRQAIHTVTDDSDDDVAKVRGLAWADVTRVTLGRFDLIVSRTGYTGERVAYELFVHPESVRFNSWYQTKCR